MLSCLAMVGSADLRRHEHRARHGDTTQSQDRIGMADRAGTRAESTAQRHAAGAHTLLKE